MISPFVKSQIADAVVMVMLAVFAMEILSN
jgi:hypothetical protein